MKIYELELEAGEPSNVAITGNYFRVLTADEGFQVRFSGNGITTDILAGLGLSVSQFDGVTLTSAVTQSITIAVGFGSVDDSRLAGQVDLNGALQMINTGAQSTNIGKITVTDTATLIRPEQAQRRSLLMRVDADCYYGNDSSVTTSTGFKIPAGGNFTIETIQDAYLVCGAGLTATCEYLEEVN